MMRTNHEHSNIGKLLRKVAKLLIFVIPAVVVSTLVVTPVYSFASVKGRGIDMKKNVNFRHVEWVNKQEDLLSIISNMLIDHPNVDQTTCKVDGESCEIKHRNVSEGEIRLHLATHIRGAEKPISPETTDKESSDLGTAKAPENTNFTEKEVAICIRESAVSYVVSGHVSSSFVQKLLTSIVGKQVSTDIANRLYLTAQADEAVVKTLISNGVDIIDLGVSMPSVDSDILMQEIGQSIGSQIGSAINNLFSTRFSKELSDEQIHELSLAKSRYIINVGKKGSSGQIEALTQVASEALVSDDEFVIRTLKGDTLRRDQLLLRRNYNQHGNSPLLSYDQAWTECSNLLDSIQ